MATEAPEIHFRTVTESAGLEIIEKSRGTGAVVVPVYVTSDRAWYFNSWDCFMLSKPFAKVILRFGEMVDLTAGDSHEDIEGHRSRLQNIMQPGLITR